MEQKMTLEEFAKQHPEYCYKPKKHKNSQMKFLCQCKFGHVFDYRDRIRFPMDDVHYAPCQGECPKCGTIAKAKKDVKIMCGDCDCQMDIEDLEDEEESEN